MELGTRKLMDRSFTGLGGFSIALMALSLAAILAPIFIGGIKAFLFQGTIEYRRMRMEQFDRGNRESVLREAALAEKAREPVFHALNAYKNQMESLPLSERRKAESKVSEVEAALRDLLGPLSGEPSPVLARQQYGQTRWDRAQVKLQKVLFKETYDYSDPTQMGKKVFVSQAEEFKGTALESIFPEIEIRAKEMLRPRWTLYWQFLIDRPVDSHFFGGIWPEMVGTLALTVGAMVFALPMGVLSAIYLTEYAPQSRLNSLLRAFISALAGVPSIVFGLFGLAFFIHTIHVSGSKSVLAGALTLAVLILPTVIRASEEAIRSVPHTYKEAALSLGASKWRTVATVILPAALPGILTGVVISMGRAAGETAPIIFTAAVSVGEPFKLFSGIFQPTPALSWNVYNLCTEHQKVDELRHVQYGMVLTLVMVVLLLDLTAIVLRARVARKLKG